MSDYYPDNWVILKITQDHGTLYKVLAGWSGGYTNGDSWRMNSGITRVEETDSGDSWMFYGSSGSCYVCDKEQYKMRMNCAGIYNKLKAEFGDIVELVDEDTDWENVEWQN